MEFQEVFMKNLKDIFLKTTKYQVSPRGMKTKEILSVTTTYQLSKLSDDKFIFPFLFTPGRFVPIHFHLYENLWILTGSQTVKDLSYYLNNMKQFSDDGVVFNAPYGYRLFVNKGDQVRKLLELFEKDIDTRRGVLEIWDTSDLLKESKDIPCNDLIFVKIRDYILHFAIMNRSNDIHLGLGTNALQFSFIARLIFNCLKDKYNLQKIQMLHYSDSLHLYLENRNELPLAMMRYQGFEEEILKEVYPIYKNLDEEFYRIENFGFAPNVFIKMFNEVTDIQQSFNNRFNLYDIEEIKQLLFHYEDFYYSDIVKEEIDVLSKYDKVMKNIKEFKIIIDYIIQLVVEFSLENKSDKAINFDSSLLLKFIKNFDLVNSDETSFVYQNFLVFLIYSLLKQKFLLTEDLILFLFKKMRFDFFISFFSWMNSILLKRIYKKYKEGNKEETIDQINFKILGETMLKLEKESGLPVICFLLFWKQSNI